MPDSRPQFLQVGERRIATLHTPGRNPALPGLVWFNGFNSVMTSTKATALAEWAGRNGRGLLRFDYSGHGRSGGAFAEGTVSDWLEESIAVLRALAAGPQILVGSSMGGWIVLLILRALARGDPQAAALPPLAAALLIAPAWDMTQTLMWEQFDDKAREALAKEGVWHRPSHYGDGPYPITARLIEDGRKHLIAATPFAPPCPVRILHGMQDPDVPWRHGARLTRLLHSDDLEMHLVADGEHRLSRPQDIARLLSLIEAAEQAHPPRPGGQ